MGFESVYKLSVIMSVIDNLSAPIKNISGNVDSAVSKLDGMSQGFSSMAQSGLALAGTGKEITEAALKPVEATFETRRALGELSSLGVKDLQKIEDAAKSFSGTFAGTTKAEYITAAYDIKSGIASLTDDGVAQYTTLAGQTAVATKATTATMTDLFATGYGIYKDFYSDLSDIQFAEMFSAGISDSVKNFKTTGTGMADAIRTLGASATTAGAPLEEQLSVLGMLQATMSGSEAGTKYKAFLRSAAKGGEELGLSFVGANGQLLSMPEILEKIRGKFGETMDAAEKMELQKAFGDTEAVALIDLMYQKTGSLQDNIVQMYGSLAEGATATNQMAEAINSTEPAQFEVLKQQIQITAESMGNTMLPTIVDFMGQISALMEKADGWIQNHQELTRIIMTVAIALGTIMMVSGIATTAIGGFGLLFSRTGAVLLGGYNTLIKLGGGMQTLYIKALYAKDGIVKIGSAVGTFGKTLITSGVQAVKGFVSSFLTMSAALLTNPVTWVIIGIVALIAAIILLWNKCAWFRDGIKSVFSFLQNGVKSVFTATVAVFTGIAKAISSTLTAAKDTVSEKLNNMKQAYTQHGGGIRGIAAAAVEGVKGYYTAGFTFLDKVTGGKLSGLKDKFSEGVQGIKNKIMNFDLKESGKKLMATFASGIKAAVMMPVDAVKGGLQKIRNMLPFSDAKDGPLNSLTLSGRKVMTTFSGGIKQEEDLPTRTVQESFEGMDFSVAAVEPKLKKEKQKEELPEGSPARTTGKRFTINHLHLEVDIKKIKDLQKLFQLMEEIEDYTNGNGPDMEPEPQPV